MCGAHGTVGGNVLAGEANYEAMRTWLDDIVEVTPRPESWLDQYDSDHPYWRSRFSDSAIDHFRLGHDYSHNAGTIPLRDTSGRVLDVARRNLGEGHRYTYPRCIKVSELIFNYHELTDDVVVLAEGPTDAIAAWEVGVQAGAIWGSRFSAAQSRLVARLDPLVVLWAGDADEAGSRAYRAVRGMLSDQVVRRVCWPQSWGKDLASMSRQRRRVIFSDVLTHRV